MSDALRKALESHVSAFEKLGHPALIMRLIATRGDSVPVVTKAARLGAQKDCFRNAANATIKTEGGLDEMLYVEGFAMNLDFGYPFHHAWTRRGPIDIEHTLRGDLSRYVYLGIAFDRKRLSEELVRNNVYGLFDTGTGVNIRLINEIAPEVVQWGQRVREKRPMIPGGSFSL